MALSSFTVNSTALPVESERPSVKFSAIQIISEN